MYKRLALSVLLFLCTLTIFAQKKTQQTDKDSLVSLLSAQSMQLIEQNGMTIRKIIGPARLFHNNTYLLCDTALWAVNISEIYAIGHVKIIQNETVLSSDQLTYYIPSNLAVFNGSVVQLQDKDKNTLKTRNLEYNTKDSVAVFTGGGAMKDKNGQLIESLTGSYQSKLKRFTFKDKVEMFTDSIFVKTDTLVYNAATDFIRFTTGTNAWKDNYMLSSEAGWYKRKIEQFLFYKKVHGLSPDKEVWCDSLYYNRLTNNIDIRGNAQLVDTSRHLTAVGGQITYTDSTSYLKMIRKPAIVGLMNDTKEGTDSVWFCADTLIQYSLPKNKINKAIIDASQERIKNINSDAVNTYRKNALEEAKLKAEEELKKDDERLRNMSIEEKKKLGLDKNGKPIQKTENKTNAVDSVELKKKIEQAKLDSIKLATDTTTINFLKGINNVKLYKKDMQLCCNLLQFNELDSLIRLYKQPVVWDQIKRQYSSDSLFVLTKNSKLYKASLLSEAFIIVQEDSLYFDQIKATEMMAYFDTTGLLKRYDALGDASAIFYLKEDSTYATVNKSAAKMLSSTFKNGELDKVYYFQQNQNDVYPLAQLKKIDRTLKGFDWQPQHRPKTRFDITKIILKQSERLMYENREKTKFKETNFYFPGYIDKVYKDIAHSKEAKAKDKERKRKLKEAQDSIAKSKPNLVKVDTKTDSLITPKDSVANKIELKDTIHRDSTTTTTQLNKKTLKQELREQKRKLKQEKLAQKWAKLDSLDAAKAKVKAEKKAVKLREKKRKALIELKKREQKEQALFEKWKAIFQRRKNKHKIIPRIN